MPKIKPMNVRNGLKAMCVIARHLDELAPYIMAFQNAKTQEIKLGLLAKAVREIVDKNIESMVAFMAYGLDISTEEAGELEFPYVLKVLPQVFAVNDFEKLMEAAMRFGLIEPKQGLKWWFVRKWNA